MNHFGSDGETASGMKRTPARSHGDGKLGQARDAQPEMRRQKSRMSSRGKRDHQQGQGKLPQDERCTEYSHCLLAEKPSTKQIKETVGETRATRRSVCVGYKGNVISRKSHILNMLFSWIRKRRKSKKGDMPETDPTKKVELEKRWSAFSLEDKYYVKSQLSIWFPCIFRHPTLSELEAALAHMGTRILDKVSRFQIIELNPNLTLSRSARNHFRIHHQKYQMNDLDGELMGALICQQESPSRSSVAFGSNRFPQENLGGSFRSDKMLSQLTLITSKMDGLTTKASNNSFLNSERNWRHNAMAGSVESPADVSPALSGGDMSELGASQLEEMYDRKKYHVPDWFYLLVQDGLAIQLLPADTDDFEIASKEVKKIVESSRRIFLSIVPNSDEHGHIFVSIAEQERRCPARNLPRKVPPLHENRQEDSSKSLFRVDPTPQSCDDSIHKTESGSRNDQTWEELFPLDRVLSFRHNWSVVNNMMTSKQGLIRRHKRKSPRKLRGLHNSGPDGNVECNTDNINFSSTTDSHKLKGNFTKRIESEDRKENVSSANLKKCRQHKQMISKILKLMKESTQADESRRGGDKCRDLLKSPDCRVTSDATGDDSFISEAQVCRRRQRSTLTKCHKNVRFADVNRLRDRVASPRIGASTEVNKSNSAIDDIDALAEANKKFLQKAENVLDKNYSSLRSEYFVPVRSRNYDVNYFTRLVKVNKACQVDRSYEAGEDSFRLRLDSDVTNLPGCFRPYASDMSSPSSRKSDSANVVLGEELVKLTNTHNGNETRARHAAKTYNWPPSSHLDQQNMREDNNEVRTAFSGIPFAVQVPSSSSIGESDRGAKSVNLCGHHVKRKYPRGTFAKFVNEHLHSDSKTELHGTKSESGHKRQPKISTSEAEETSQHAPRISPSSREKRRWCPKARTDGRKTNQTGEITEQDYEIACANRRLGYNYICTVVDDYYKSFLSREDKPSGMSRIPYQGSETSRHSDGKSNRADKCFHYKTGGPRDVVVKSRATPEDNRSLTRLIDRYLNSGDKKVVDITKPLKDLDALLEYCSKMTSEDFLLGDTTLGILRAINDVITRFIKAEDEKSAARVKGENAMFKKNQVSGPLQKLCRPYNVSRCKVLIDVATQTHLKAVNLCGESEWCRCWRPKYPVEHLVGAEHRKVPFIERSCETFGSSGSAFRPLDETQNKLDSDVDDQAASRIRISDVPVGKPVSLTTTENGHSTPYGRPWGKELDRLFALRQKPPTDASSVYSDTPVDLAQKSDTVQSRNSPERPAAPAFFSSQKLTSVVTLGGASNCSVPKDRVTFQRTRKEPSPMETIITPASPPNLSDNHGSLASDDNGKSSTNGPDDMLYRHYLGVIHGTDTLRPASLPPQATQEHTLRYGEPRRPSYFDGAISQSLRPEQPGRTSDETYGLPARESTGIQTSKIISMESTFNPNGGSSFDRSPKPTDSFATLVSNPNTSCNKVDCQTRVCTGHCVSRVCTGECVSQVCMGGCLTTTCPVKCLPHPCTSICSPCASALPRSLECHCKPEVPLRSCMTPPPWRPKYRLCKNSLDDNLGSYLCHQNRVSDLPSSFLNIRPSLNVTPHARGCHRTINDIFCDPRREYISPDCFSDYRRRPAHDCLNFFERKLNDKIPSYPTRNSRYLNMPSVESVPEALRRIPFQRSEPLFKVADPNTVSDIQQQTLALIGQVLNTLQANSKPPDAKAAQKPNASPSSDFGSCGKPCKERRCLAAPRKKCKKMKPECPCKNREEDPPSEQSSQRVPADVKPMNFEIDFMDEISEQSLPRTRMCTKSLQVNMDACVRQAAQASPKQRALVRNVGMASVQTCACISKPTGECQCGCLSEKLVISQRKCPCADQLLVDLPVDTSVCPCAVKKQTCSANRCPKPVTSSCGQKCLECSENKSVQTSVACQKASSNKKCQIGKLNPVACVSTDVCGSRLLNEVPLGACGKNSLKQSWNQPLKQSRSSEVCGDSDVSDCTSTVHRFPTGQRSTTGHGPCQRKSPRINFHFPSHKFCDKLRSCLQNPCDNASLRESKYETDMASDYRNTYPETYSRSTTPCRQRRSERASRSFQSLLDSNYMPVRSSVANRNPRTEPLYSVPECDCAQEKSNQFKSCNSCATRRDSSPRKFSETAPDAYNVRKTAWCECSAPKFDANEMIKVADSTDPPKPADIEVEKLRPFVHIKYKSKKIVSDKAGEVQPEQACSAYGVKGLAEQLKEQIDEIISRSRDLQQQALQFNTGSPRFCVNSVAENRLTGCDGRLPSADNFVPASDNRFTFSDNRVAASDNRLTASDKRYSASDNRFSSSDNRFSAPEIRFTGCDNNATGSVNRSTVASNDARAQNIPASPGSEPRPSSVAGVDLRASNTLTSPRSDVKVRNSHFSTSGYPGSKSSGLVAPHNSIVEGADDASPRISQARSRDLSVLGDLKMTGGTGAGSVKDGSYRPVEGESTVIDMESRGSQDVIRFQTQREGSEGWSFYEVEVNDPKGPADVKKSEGSPNKNSNSNTTGGKVETESIKQLGNYDLKPKLCASNSFNLFPDASRTEKMACRFPEPMKCAMNKVCPACKQTYTIVPGFRPVVLGHCTNLNVSWNASSGEETQNTGQATRDVFSLPREAAGTPPNLVETLASDHLNYVRSRPPTREGYRKNACARTVYFTPERMQDVKSRAKNLKHDVAIFKDGKSGCGADGDRLMSKRMVDSPSNIHLNANGYTAPRKVRRRSFIEDVCNVANQNGQHGQNRSHRRPKNAPVLRNKNINSVEYHEISCEDPVSSSNGHQFDTNSDDGNRATKTDQTVDTRRGVTTPSQFRPRKTTIIEDFSDAASTAEFFSSHKRQHLRHDGRKHRVPNFTRDPLDCDSVLKTGTPTCIRATKPLLKSCRTRARHQCRLQPQCVNVETLPIEQDRTHTRSGLTNSVLEKNILLVQRAKQDQNHRDVVEKKDKIFFVEDNGGTKSTTHVTTHGMMTSDGTRKSLSADSAASSHGIEDLPTDSWVNVTSGTFRVKSKGNGSSPSYPYVGEPHNDALEHEELVQRVWRGDVSEASAERSTVISDDCIITPRPWREGVSRKKRVCNACEQMGEELNHPSACGHLPVSRNSSSVVSENITLTPRRRWAEHISDQTELDLSTSDQFNDTLTGSDCATRFSRPWFPKGELVRWWNSPGGLHEGGDDAKELLQVSSGSRGDTHSYSYQLTKQRIMTNERVVASILGTDVIRRIRRPGWTECKDSATVTDDILSGLTVQNVKNSTEILEISAVVTKRLQDASADASQGFQMHAGPFPMKSGSSIKPPDVSPRGNRGAQAGDGSWRNVLVSCAELTEASDERVLLEGSFHTSWNADRGEPFDGVSRASRPAPAPLPFKLVLFARADGDAGTKVYGTFLRRLSQCDRSFKWKVKANIPCKI